MFHSFLMKDPDYKLTKEQVVKMDSLYEELNKKQQQYALALLQGLSPAEAKKKANYSRNAPEDYSEKLKKYLDTLDAFKIKTILTEKEKHVSRIEKYINKLEHIMDNAYIDLRTIGTGCYIKAVRESVNAMQEIAKLKGFYVEQEIQKETLANKPGKLDPELVEAIAKLDLER
tara:strand:- start:2025 stop:2543 length:519 start_codon:yes stop_codon:yes gene_type:complete